jgi:protoporphyrinogen oxidase
LAESESLQKSVAIIGAGPAGLTAAYTLLKKSGGRIKVTVCEANPQYVGGISRTVNYKGFHFDIGGHRFFSKSKEVEDLWTELLPEDMLERPRLSRIFYRGKFFSYPLRALEALFKLGFVQSLLCMASYVRARLFPIPDPRSFEDWVSNKFGRRLFKIFFKTYTEKVWGMNCRDISADWAAQRIKDLSLISAIVNSIFPRKASRPNSQQIKTLVNTFRYPRKGPGMLWAACAEKVTAMGGEILMGHGVTRCVWNKADGLWTVEARDVEGNAHSIRAQHLISSAALSQLAQSLSPPLPERALGAARSLKYRDFLTVSLIVKDRGIFQDNWIYIHDASVRVGRIQNFKSWSPEMVPSPDLNCYGLEYFCFEGDGLWSASDETLLELATTELVKIGLAEAKDVIDGCVVRQAKAYPVYDDAYAEHVASLRAELEAHFPTLHLVGRNGMHKYNNQDHAMMTAMLCAENILAGARLYDVWCVNQDAEYHEQGDAHAGTSVSGVRLVPSRLNADK